MFFQDGQEKDNPFRPDDEDLPRGGAHSRSVPNTSIYPWNGKSRWLTSRIAELTEFAKRR